PSRTAARIHDRVRERDVSTDLWWWRSCLVCAPPIGVNARSCTISNVNLRNRWHRYNFGAVFNLDGCPSKFATCAKFSLGKIGLSGCTDGMHWLTSACTWSSSIAADIGPRRTSSSRVYTASVSSCQPAAKRGEETLARCIL